MSLMSCFNDFDWVEDIEPMIPEEKVIIDLIDSCEKKPFKNGFLYIKDGKNYFYQVVKNKIFYYDYDNVYSVLETKFGLRLLEINGLIGGILERRYNLDGYIVKWPWI